MLIGHYVIEHQAGDHWRRKYRAFAFLGKVLVEMAENLYGDVTK